MTLNRADTAQPPGNAEFRCDPDPRAVRDLMSRLGQHLKAIPLAPEMRSNVEIAVTEALNNIVEHAFVAGRTGDIRLSLVFEGSGLLVHLRDPGRALPGLEVPDKRFPDVSVARETLPEGGFGWALIHSLTDGIDYQRIGGVNELRLWFTQGPDRA